MYMIQSVDYDTEALTYDFELPGLKICEVLL
jgi:hypothetical protein